MPKSQVSKSFPIEFSEVCEVLYQDLLGTNGRSLSGCFAKAQTDGAVFDPNFEGDKDRLSNWRGFPLIPEPCGTGSSYPDGAVSYPTYVEYDMGADIGESTLDFNALNVPDRFIVKWNGSVVIDTGYVGSSVYDFGGGSRQAFKDSLIGKTDPINSQTYPNTGTWPDDGYPRVTDLFGPTYPGEGTENFTKTLASPSKVEVYVYAPMPTTAWSIDDFSCPSDIEAPSIPTGLNATTVGSTSFTLNWSASTDNVGVTGYKIYKNDVLHTTVGVVTSKLLTGLTNGASDTWKVSAIDANSNESIKSTGLLVNQLTLTEINTNIGGEVDGNTACSQVIDTPRYKDGHVLNINNGDTWYLDSSGISTLNGSNAYFSNGTVSFQVSSVGVTSNVQLCSV